MSAKASYMVGQVSLKIGPDVTQTKHVNPLSCVNYAMTAFCVYIVSYSCF